MTRSKLSISITALSLALSACAPTPTTNTDAGDAAIATGDATGPADAGPTSLLGTVTVGFIGSAGEQGLTVGARSGAPTLDCAPAATMGSCEFRDCAPAGTDMRPRVPVGDVTATAGAMTVTSRPNAMNEYGLETTRFPAGSTVTVRVPGAGGVPAMEGTVLMPSSMADFAIQSPPAATMVDRSGDLVVDWTGENYGNVVVSLSATTGNAFVRCTFPAGTMRGTIPSGLLTRMPTGEARISAAHGLTAERVVSGWKFETAVIRGIVLEGPLVQLR